MKYCTKCGKENNDNAAFCQSCGQALTNIPRLIDNNSDKEYFTPKYKNQLIGAGVISSILILISMFVPYLKYGGFYAETYSISNIFGVYFVLFELFINGAILYNLFTEHRKACIISIWIMFILNTVIYLCSCAITGYDRFWRKDVGHYLFLVGTIIGSSAVDKIMTNAVVNFFKKR